MVLVFSEVCLTFIWENLTIPGLGGAASAIITSGADGVGKVCVFDLQRQIGRTSRENGTDVSSSGSSHSITGC